MVGGWLHTHRAERDRGGFVVVVCGAATTGNDYAADAFVVVVAGSVKNKAICGPTVTVCTYVMSNDGYTKL